MEIVRTQFKAALITKDGFDPAEIAKITQNIIPTGTDVQVLESRSLEAAQPSDYEALILSESLSGADELRTHPGVLEWVRHFSETKKPMAIVGHAAWILISAGVVDGRILTSAESIKDDLKNAGAFWTDQAAVCDHQWVSCRGVDDLHSLTREWTKLLSRTPHASPTASVVNVAMSA